MHVFGLWQEANSDTGKLHTERPRMMGLRTQPSCCEVTVLNTAPPCQPFIERRKGQSLFYSEISIHPLKVAKEHR